LTAVGDVQFYMLLTLPTLLDAGLVTAWGHDKPEVGTQILGMNLLAYGTAGLVAYSVATLVARERPFTDECADDPDYDAGCGNAGSENASFFSGHSAAAFTGAGVMCAHHQFLPVYGGGALDTAACAVSVAMATSVTLLRVMTDNHYLTDSLVGSAVGFGLGYGLPYLLHYQHGQAAPALALMPLMDADHVGLAVRFSE
jgi:membrane-associated phospholipid phosphatase